MEKLSNFQYIWKNWIEPLIEDLFKQLDPNFKEACNVKIRNLDKVMIKAEKYYQMKRLEAKRNFYGNYNKGDSVDEHRMDFHKIGAVICRTLIEYKVIEFDINACNKYIDKHKSKYDTDWVVKNALINYRLAFYSSIVFLYHTMLYKYQGDEAIMKKLLEKKCLDLYDRKINRSENRVHESFENCIVLDLSKRDIENYSFDYFMYAVILYQLEEHNKNL